MKRYSPIMGILTFKNGDYVKLSDVEAALDRLAAERENFAPWDKTAYRQALEDLRKELHSE